MDFKVIEFETKLKRSSNLHNTTNWLHFLFLFIFPFAIIDMHALRERHVIAILCYKIIFFPCLQAKYVVRESHLFWS